MPFHNSKLHELVNSMIALFDILKQDVIGDEVRHATTLQKRKEKLRHVEGTHLSGAIAPHHQSCMSPSSNTPN